MNQLADENKLQRVYRHLSSEIRQGQLRTGQRLPTEQELAQRFGFSRATVAKAVRQLAREGLVQRRRRAGSFVCAGRTAATGTLGALICGAAQLDTSSNIFIPISSEIAHTADERGFAVLVQDPWWRAPAADEVAERLRRFTRQFIERKVTGVFLVPPEIREDQLQSLGTIAAELLDDAGIPLVLIDRDIHRYPQRSKYDLIGIDNARAARVLTDHLLSIRHGRIDFIMWPRETSAAAARVNGYCDALRSAGIPPQDNWIHRGDSSNRTFIESVLADPNADTFVAINDATAADVMRHALALGKRVPQDVRIVGFDDLTQSRYLSTPLTTIRQHGADIGAAAVRTLFDRIANPTRRPIDVHVAFDLIIRQSCGSSAT